MANPICWFEIGTKDLDKSKKFYEAVFDWDLKKDEHFPDMEMIETGERPQGAIFKGPPEMPLAVNVYFQVDSVDETIGKVTGAGGSIIMPKTEIPMVGWFAVFLDTEGVAVSIFEPNPDSQM